MSILPERDFTMALPNFNNSNPSHLDFAALPSLRATPINITLIRQPFGADSSFQQRQLVVNPGEPIVVGRASKSESKNCRPHPFNALFDCPVVSRMHAEFRSNAFKPDGERVCIIDRGSMHGTTVNNVRLVPFEPHTLHNGDVIKFGDQVTRGAGVSRQASRSHHPANTVTDLHDGVKVVFSLDDASPCCDNEPHALAGTTFGVPSASEADSESEDDKVAVSNRQTCPTSSADLALAQDSPTSPTSLTSPLLAPLGSQQQPIDLEQPHGPLYNVINLDDDELGPEVPLWAAPAKKFIPDTYAESDGESGAQHNTGLQRILLDDGSDQRSVHRDTYEDESDSECSDASLHDSDDASSSYASLMSRESCSVSVTGAEYGQNEESDDSLLDLQSSPELGTQRGSMSHLLFDKPQPIRYTRWDVRPNQSQHLYRPLQPNHDSTPYGLSPSYWTCGPAVPPTSAPSPKPDALPTASRISIPNLVQQPYAAPLHPEILPNDTIDANVFNAEPTDLELTELDPLPGNASTLSSPSGPAVVSGTKRKVDEMSSDEGVPFHLDEDWNELYHVVCSNRTDTAEPTLPEAPEKMGPPAKKTRVQKRRGSKFKKVAKYAAIGGASALAGSVGMFTFLVSPLAQRIIEWASV